MNWELKDIKAALGSVWWSPKRRELIGQLPTESLIAIITGQTSHQARLHKPQVVAGSELPRMSR